MVSAQPSHIHQELPPDFDGRSCEAMDAAPVMIWASGPDKDCVWFNRPWLTFTGRTMDQELGDGWTKGVHPDDHERCIQTYVSHFDSRTDFRMQYRLRRHDAIYRWIDDTGSPRYSSDGTFLGYIGSCVDITHFKETEEALREHATRLRLATSSAKLGVYERDIRADRTVWVNERMYEIFGRSAQDGPLTREIFFRDYLHQDDVATFETATKRALETGAGLHVTCRIRLSTGEQRWLQIDGIYERSESGEPLRLIGVAADVTERKILEQRAVELSNRLVNVQEEERQRIAQELHDSTTQHLVAVGLNLGALKPKAGLTSDEIGRWHETEACLQEAINEIRTFSYLMHPPTLHTDRLIASIEVYIKGFSDRTKINVRTRFNPNLDELPYEMQRTLLRITQEALANVHRHAQASRVCVVGRVIANRIHLIISDDGRGLRAPVKQLATPGRGILGMEDRARRWGGEFRLLSESGGTVIHASWRVPK
jgi:PAS domain S-box-containing protein